MSVSESMPLLPHEQGKKFHITPVFSHMSVFNEVKSQIEGRPVHELKEVVTLRLSGDRNYAPVFPADAMAVKDSIGRVVTFAEMFSEQYKQFIMGSDQTAGGTALEELRAYGITPAQISRCRALNVYSIEALATLPQDKYKNFGFGANELRAMAVRYMTDRKAKVSEDIDSLRARLAELERQAAEVSAQADDEQVDPDDDPLLAMTDDELRELIRERTGEGVRGRPSRDTLLAMARGE